MNYTGKLLITPPSVKDKFWGKTIVLVTEHYRNGSCGLILNKNSTVSLTEFSKKLGVDLPMIGSIYVGGPVDISAVTMLHTAEWSCNNTLQINEQYSISSTKDLFVRLANGDCPEFFKIFMGRCVWMPGQLHDEVKGNYPNHHDYSWLVTDPIPEIVFDNNDNTAWHSSLSKCAEDFVHNILV